ncbi:MAG: methyl-accepting chemotaxis protein [Candidatus Tectimicrobiota bacterium]
MPSLFRVHDWSLSTKFGVGAVTTAAIPPLLMGALGVFQPDAAGTSTERLLYLAAAVCAVGLAGTTWRVFTQQASQITALITQLHMHIPRRAAEAAESGRGAEGAAGVCEKTLALLQSQTEHLAASVATVDDLTASIEHVAEHVALSATTAEQTLSSAQQSATTVQSTVHECRQLRLQLQDSAKRIQHLEEHAQEVQGLGAGIADLADRTSVLALNVSVQAAQMDGPGHASAVIAAEVEHVAGRTLEATQRITHLVHTIQRETEAVVRALEASTRELTQWAEQTAQAGQAVGEIEQLSTRLTDLIAAISQAVARQASSSATLSRAMSEMSSVTQQTAAGTQDMAASMHNLTQLASALRSSVHGQRQAA